MSLVLLQFVPCKSLVRCAYNLYPDAIALTKAKIFTKLVPFWAYNANILIL